MSMFCFQCQETAKGTGCEVRGVCGKTEDVAKFQDLLVYTIKGIAQIVIKSKLDIAERDKLNYEMLNSLFMTITNANFDDEAIEKQISKMLSLRNELREKTEVSGWHDAAVFEAASRQERLDKAVSVGVLATKNEDVRSLKEMIIYGLKGMAAYAEHAKNFGGTYAENR